MKSGILSIPSKHEGIPGGQRTILISIHSEKIKIWWNSGISMESGILSIPSKHEGIPGGQRTILISIHSEKIKI